MSFSKILISVTAALAAALFLLLSGAAHAGDLAVRWTPPTTNTDGSSIPASGAGSLTGTRLEWGTCSGTAFGTSIGSTIVAAPATSHTVTGLAPGTYCVRAFARNTYGSESAASVVASKVIVAPVPNPPLLSIDTTAYELRLYSNGTLRFVAVGTVPLNAACGPKLAGQYAAFEGAKITKATSGGIIAARCASS